MKTRTRLLSSLGAILLTASAVISEGALPATAATGKPINKYVALGDSFAAGQGALPYLNVCLQSTNGYPALLDAVKGINLLRNASCSGATTENVKTTQLSSLNRGTTLVTLTVGGNDVNVAGVAAACTLDAQGQACAIAFAAALALLDPSVPNPVLFGSLASTYAGIAAAAPNARLLVTGYPYLFETPALTDSNFGTILAINNATDLLNGTIQGAVLAQSKGANIYYVDVTAPFAGHGIGSTHPWITDPWTNPLGAEAFHPNAAGYVAYANALRQAVATNRQQGTPQESITTR